MSRVLAHPGMDHSGVDFLDRGLDHSMVDLCSTFEVDHSGVDHSGVGLGFYFEVDHSGVDHFVVGLFLRFAHSEVFYFPLVAFLLSVLSVGLFLGSIGFLSYS